MTKQQTHAGKTSAADKSIGFEYQYYYFLYKVLKMGRRESVGLEVNDDVYTSLECNRQILIQLKHTTQNNSGGKPKNLTTYDHDLWKTLSNWSKIISDIIAKRNSEKSQLDFIGKTDFMLVTNKSETASCRVIDVLNGQKNARVELQMLKSGTKDKNIQQYIDDIMCLSDQVMTAFMRNIRLELEVDDVVGLCKEALLEMRLPENRIDQVFCDLDSRIRQDNFLSIRNGEKIIITFDQFNQKYRRYFDNARSTELQVKQYHEPLPTSLEEQIFIKQLLDIGDIKLENIDEIAQYTIYMMNVRRNFLSWETNGELTQEEVVMFNNEAKLRWSNKFRSIYRDLDCFNSDLKALEILDEMRKEKLCIDKQQMSTEFSNGEYYHLSNIPEIGWHGDWEKKYK